MVTEADKKADWVYEGRVYIRPVGRGADLIDLDGTPIDEALSTWIGLRYYVEDGWRSVRITIEDLGEVPEERQTYD